MPALPARRPGASLEQALRQAVDRQELQVHYQPIFSLAHGRTLEVEALLRWRKDGAQVSAADFIPVAEQTGLILKLGTWVLEQACRQVARWQREIAGAEHLVASVNLSGRQFQHAGLVDEIRRVLVRTGLSPEYLNLEITETVSIEDCEIASRTLRTLRDCGIRLAIDDFGTGYSSLSYLKHFPVDSLKIDRSFVCSIERDARDAAIVQGVTALAGALGLQVTAEGIESHAQWVRLRELGCNRGQGYLYARPMTAEDLEPVLRKSLSLKAAA